MVPCRMQLSVRSLAVLFPLLPLLATAGGCGSSAAGAGDAGAVADGAIPGADGAVTGADGALDSGSGSVADGAPIAPVADGSAADGAGSPGGPTSGPWTKGTVTSRSLLSFGKVFAAHKTATYLAFGYNDSGGNSQGGLLVTKDQGVTWTEVTTLPPVDPSFGANAKHNLSHVASDGARLYVVSGMVVGVLASDDDGATWMTLPAPPRTSRPAMIAAVAGKLYAGSGEGAFVSTDKGATWTSVVPSESANRPIHSIVEAGGGIWFASSNRMLFAPGGDPAQLAEAKQGLAFPGGVEQLAVVGTTLIAAGPGIYKATAAGAATLWTPVSLNDAITGLMAARGAFFGLQRDKPVLITTTATGVATVPFDMGLPTGPFEGLGAGADTLFAAMPGAVWHTPLK
jgi:hypothetical protein